MERRPAGSDLDDFWVVGSTASLGLAAMVAIVWVSYYATGAHPGPVERLTSVLSLGPLALFALGSAVRRFRRRRP
jgi:hypothetical protein